MICREALAHLTAYLDGELDGTTASAIRGHLRVCDACRGAAEDHAAIRDTLAGLERPEPPPAVWDGVLARLGEAEIADGRRSRWARLYDRVRPHFVPASVAIGACAAAALVIHLRQADPARPGARPEAAVDVAVTAVAAPGAPGLERLDPAMLQAPAPAPRVTRDATAELVDEAERIDGRYRSVAAELLEQAREAVGERTAARRRFDREVAVLERTVLDAAAGKPRDRAWHALLVFLERAALGERVAEVRR